MFRSSSLGSKQHLQGSSLGSTSAPQQARGGRKALDWGKAPGKKGAPLL
jgi:hypothetical protein